MKDKTRTIILTALHAALTMALFLWSSSMGMRRFDTGGTAELRERILQIVSITLMCPIFYPLSLMGGGLSFPGLLGYLPLLANSFLWVIGLTGIINWLRIKKE